MTRVFAISDLHLDFKPNREWLRGLPANDHRDDALVVAGDLSDRLELLTAGLAHLKQLFPRVFFVPGNHDLWVRRKECPDSLEKFRQVLDACARLGVETAPARLGEGAGAAWVVPLFSWYEKPEEGPGSLFVPKNGEDPTLAMWSDNYFTSWPPLGEGLTVARHFLRLNEPHLERRFDAPVLSFSHFLPRTDLIFSHPAQMHRRDPHPLDPHPSFNFSRVAGSRGLEEQIRRLGSAVHVYGHQHRNRWREVDGVFYVSHCLGSVVRSSRAGLGVEAPRQIWPLPAEGA